MKISDRFTDYGLIGGFFWLLQFALMATFGIRRFWLAGEVHSLETLLKDLPPGALPPLAALVGALALTAIFATGLLLDLFGSTYFRGTEMNVFIWYARRNALWVQRLFDQHKDYIQNDWSVLFSAAIGVPHWKKQISAVIRLELMFWNRRVREEYASLISKGRATLQAYTEMQAFLISYVLVVSGSGNIEFLSTQLSLWTTSRAISTAVGLAALEPILFFSLFGSAPRAAFFIAEGMAAILTWLAIAITRSAHGRACSTLFSLAYVTYEKAAGATQGAGPK
jgi:hypothetical protein